MADFTPTPEQSKIIDLVLTGANIAVEAGAGTGKTSTMVLIAEALGSARVQYLAFNKAIVLDATEDMPKNVACNTAHSLAARSFGRPYLHRLRQPRIKSNQLARLMRMDPMVVAYGMVRKPMAAGYLAGLVMRTIRNFCQSIDLDPARKHMPYIDGIDVPTIDGKRTYANNDLVWEHIAPAVRRAWADLMDPHGQLPYRHEHYLKGWHLSGPRIDADVIMFDEAQDANPVLIDIVRQQHHAQQIFVGDSQQAIYEFTGAVNALDRIREAGGETAFLTQSFRFGPAVAEVANGILARLDAPLSLIGTPSIPSTVTEIEDPDVILTRTNATAVRLVLDAMDEGKRANLVGGGAEVISFCKGARDLQAGRHTENPDLACFTTWGEVQDYADNDQQGDEIRLLVKLVDDFGAAEIINALDTKTSTERQADLVVSTAHKSKGREWNRVQLADDFFTPRDGETDVNDGELRLLYVAVTRAKLALDVTRCPMALGRKDNEQGRAESLPTWGTEDADDKVEEMDAKALTLRYL